jgi:predicted bacteriocin transport accessory protein
MKKTIFIILFLLFFLVGCGNTKITPDKTTVNLANVNHFHLIEDLEIFNNLVSSNKEFIIVAGQTTCGACITYQGVLNEYIEETSVRIYYINVNEIEGSIEALRIQGKLETTPTTFIYQKGSKGESILMTQFGFINNLEDLKTTFTKYINIA